MVDQADSGDHHRLEKGVASLEKNLPLDQGRCCSAWLVAGSRGCCEHSPEPSEVSRKVQQGLVVVGGHPVRVGSGHDTFRGRARKDGANENDE